MAQHFLFTAEARSMSLREIFEMTDDAAFGVFRKSRWVIAMRWVVQIAAALISITLFRPDTSGDASIVITRFR